MICIEAVKRCSRHINEWYVLRSDSHGNPVLSVSWLAPTIVIGDLRLHSDEEKLPRKLNRTFVTITIYRCELMIARREIF